ncbi:hypothetical protein TSUD_104590 [Trifolium subterraneum]|uniref:EF-hand domain-containing protein n=1 Tax=Trifolium subterraneum TaxID=3900 RepID=A0A2Z6M4R2_TRISU|nr:hypothetical protein TSUD_104590 [Trifolium subterraneum]
MTNLSKLSSKHARAFCLLVILVDMLAYALYISPVAFNFLPFRIAPYIRVVLFVLNIRPVPESFRIIFVLDLYLKVLEFRVGPNSTVENRLVRELRETVIIVAGMLDTYLNILALGLLFLVFASWVAYVIFEDTIQGKTVFTSYSATLYHMFLLFNTANNPDVWVPAYKSSRWSILFFILFVLIGVYFVTNLILAVVYDSFKSELVKQVSEMDRMRRAMLEKAFNLLDTNKDGYLKKDQCIRLFEEVNKYRTLPKISKEEFELIFDELDDTHDVKINKDEFADICNAIALRFQKEDVSSYFDYLVFYHSSTSKRLKAFVKSTMFGYIVTFVLILNLVAVIIETTLDVEENSAQKAWQVVEFTFGWIYVIEMILKVYSHGFENYWRDGQNRFDFVITVTIVGGKDDRDHSFMSEERSFGTFGHGGLQPLNDLLNRSIGETIDFASPDDGLPFFTNGEWIRYLLLARMLRLIRLLMYVQRFRSFVATFLTLIPSLMPYLGTIFCILCIYCSLGVQIFGGLVNAGNPDLEATDLAANELAATILCYLFCSSLNNCLASYKDLTGTSWTYVYFISFYLITVLLLLNLIIAFVLEAFFAEIELESSENCDGNGKEDAGDRNPRRRTLGTKSRSQRVDALLHHMLSAELSQNQPSNT